MVTVTCSGCGTAVSAQRRTRKWCDACSNRRQTIAKGPVTGTCAWCRETFTFERGNRAKPLRYCGAEHSRLATRRARLESKHRAARGEPRLPTGRRRVLSDEERSARAGESRLDRFLRLHPDRQRRCEARGCGETRVVEMAHKPHCKRNGRNPSGYVHDDDVWLLCPTCHRVIDYGVATPAELGLT